jgi:hypothetical protein
VVLTADHGHTSQIVAEDTNGENGPTGAEDLVTKDGQTIRISYGTAGGLTRPAPQRSASSTPAPRSASRPSARRRPASTA